jgi:predicted Zn-dependent protease
MILAALLASLQLVTAQADHCASLDHHGERAQSFACYQSLIKSGGDLERAEGYVGIHKYKEANDEFRQADQNHASSAQVKTEWGNLYLLNAQPSDAAELFKEAAKSDSTYAPAYLGLSKALSEGYDNDAVALAQTALHYDAKYYPAHEFLAYLALEIGNQKLATEEAKKAMAISPDALDALAVLASIDCLNGNGLPSAEQSPWMQKLLGIDANYGEAFAMAGHFLEINYRYNDAIAAYRMALDLNTELLPARSELGIDLMRTGQTAEAQEQLKKCFENHFRNAETVNSLRFLDSLSQYDRFTTDSTELLLSKNESALLRPYIQPELEAAMRTYERKYKMMLPGRVRLEVYPNHEDFIVRTLGLPGQGGLLGVTFGTVVAIDSPSARPEGEFSWADTMWHELCHVYVITATHNLVPRWFSEGLAVHEEGMASPQWGNRLTPDTIQALKQKKLLPVLQLDAGFVRPQYPGQVLVSYYQAGKICDFIAQKWGDDAILGMMHSYAAHKSTQDAIQDNLHESPEGFDKEFLTWLAKSTDGVAMHFDQWKAGMSAATLDLEKGNAAAAFGQLSAVQSYYPEYPGTFDTLARCLAALGRKQESMTALEQYQITGGTGVPELKQLATLETEFGHPQKAVAALEEVNLIYPEDHESHQLLGDLLLKEAHPIEAIQEYRALLTLKPADSAAAHFNLARALNAAHNTSEARDQVLLTLEAAPNYKPAQQLLLQLSQ